MTKMYPFIVAFVSSIFIAARSLANPLLSSRAGIVFLTQFSTSG
jgi:hypothetical protein